MNRSKIIRMPVGQSKWVVTNGYRWVAICRFKSDAEHRLANLKIDPFYKEVADQFYIVKGAR